MKKIYLDNHDLAKEILRDRESAYKVRGFGWVTIHDWAAWNRLSKAIFKRSDPKIISRTFWSAYLISYGLFMLGLIFMVLDFAMKILA